MDAGLYLPFQPLPLDSRFLYQAAYMMPPFKCLLDISSTEAASWFFIYKLASAEDNSILSIPLAKNLSYSLFFLFLLLLFLKVILSTPSGIHCLRHMYG